MSGCLPSESMIAQFLYRYKRRTEYLNYGGDIIYSWAADYSRGSDNLKILDIGFSEGRDLLSIKEHLPGKKVELFGVDCRNVSVAQAGAIGIRAVSMNIENEPLPFADAHFDIVVANMVLEHTKEIFWIFSEISSTLKRKGVAIIGVPNLASLHNRLALLIGQQPLCMRLFGSHVRGFTQPSFAHFIRQGGYFRLLQVRGANFYPFPSFISKVLARALPTMAVSLFFLVERTEKSGRFISVLDDHDLGTPYFIGDWHRAKPRWKTDCRPAFSNESFRPPPP